MNSVFKQAIVLALVACVAAAPQAAASECAICPATDLNGLPLVAASGGTIGVPAFCGYVPF